jgi:hypothetical protein
MAKKPASGLSASMLTADLPPPSETAAAYLENHPAIKKAIGNRAQQPVTTTVKLEQETYRRLKAYCADNRITGQAVSVKALEQFLTAVGY